jgi:hypothetical protein
MPFLIKIYTSRQMPVNPLAIKSIIIKGQRTPPLRAEIPAPVLYY